MRHRLGRLLFRCFALIAAALCAVLLIESVRSFHQSDTVTIVPLTFVTHRGSLYVLPSTEMLGADSQPVNGAPAWPVTLVAMPLRTWHEGTVFGVNAWSSGVFFVFQCPIWFPLLILALLAICCHRRYAEILPRTHYLECPSCGHLLVGVVHWRCPECGRLTISRVVEALPPSAALPASTAPSAARPPSVSSPASR